MPLRAGTLAETRTQVDVRCDYCGHELTIEMTPPVLIVTPERQEDSAASSGRKPMLLEGDRTNDRRSAREANRQRMRVGLRGLLKSANGRHTVTVLYSLDGHRARGRMRPLDPSNLFPSWLDAERLLKLHGYDGLPVDICVTAVKLPRDDRKGDDHFAEFVVRQVTR